jgi:hypothetical protein
MQVPSTMQLITLDSHTKSNIIQQKEYSSHGLEFFVISPNSRKYMANMKKCTAQGFFNVF